MISGRLLDKLQIGKKYLITDGGGFFILDVCEEVIWCSQLGWKSEGFFGIYKKDWDSILDENKDDSKYWRTVKYDYDLTKPTYSYYAHISKLFVSGQAYFNTYNLYFLGEYGITTEVKDLIKYCNVFKLNYKYFTRKERLLSLYGGRIMKSREKN